MNGSLPPSMSYLSDSGTLQEMRTESHRRQQPCGLQIHGRENAEPCQVHSEIDQEGDENWNDDEDDGHSFQRQSEKNGESHREGEDPGRGEIEPKQPFGHHRRCVEAREHGAEETRGGHEEQDQDRHLERPDQRASVL